MLTKRILIAVVAIVMLGTTPILAELDGKWKGEGDGIWIHSSPSGIAVLHPWQNWEGIVKNGSFTGTWSDAAGYTGGFQGSVTAISLTTALVQGTWSWYDISGIMLVGPFQMKFNYIDEVCKGTWTSYDAKSAEPLGTMWGERAGWD
jgi:hypothetical protein